MDCRVLFCARFLLEWDTYLVVRMAASGAGFLWHCVDLPVALPLPAVHFPPWYIFMNEFENLRIFQVLQTYMRSDCSWFAFICQHFHAVSECEVLPAGMAGRKPVSMALLTFGVISVECFLAADAAWCARCRVVLFSAAASLVVCNVFASIP